MVNPQQFIHDNYCHVLERIDYSARTTGRNPGDIRLVVVTKTHPVETIQRVVDEGVIDLGENYIDEALSKVGALRGQEIRWHMIGHVQSRKAEDVCRYFQYLHSLDSLKLASKLSKFAGEMDMHLPVWLEFNTGGEETKSGWNIAHEDQWNFILPDIEQVLTLPNLDYLGVMTIPPYSEDPETSRIYYQKLRTFQDFIIQQFHLPGFRELSMGMSSDYEVAIQEGSTCVRIGQAILGPRSR